MSIAAMADVRLQRTEAKQPSKKPDDKEPKTKAGIPAGVLNTLVQWVPTETVATYVAVQSVMPAVVIPEGKKAFDADYSDRWLLFYIMLAVTVAMVPIYTLIKTRSSSTNWKWPVLEMWISAAAFTLWAIALVDSPFADFENFDEWLQVLAIVGGGGVLGALTVALKTTPAWADTSKTNTVPSPNVR